MKRIRTLSVITVVVLALAGVSAASAAASANQFRAWSYPATVQGSLSSELSLKFGESSLKCLKGSLSGTSTEASSSLTMTPSFQTCKTYGVSSPVHPNSCNYVFSEEEAVPHSRLSIVCSKEGDAIEVLPTGVECTIRIPAQGSLSGVAFADTSSSTMTVNLSLSKLKVVEIGAGCPKPGEHANAELTGTYSLTGIATGSRSAMFETESYPAAITTESGDIGFSFGSPSFNCTEFTGEGLITGASSSFNLQPTTWGCKAFGAKAPVANNGCYFVLHGSPISDYKSEGSTDIACGAGATITVTTNVYFCEYKLPAQNGIKSLSYADEGSKSGRIITTAVKLSGLEYTESGWGCESPGTHKNGTLSGTWPLRAYQSESGGHKGPQIGLWIA